MRNKRILYIQYTNPACYPPLEHSSHILARDGWQVLFLGTGAFGNANNLRLYPHRNITVRQLSFCQAGWIQKLHYIWFWVWAILWTLYWQPEWVYASNALSCPISLVLSYFPSIKIIYHEHDLPLLQQKNENPASNFMRFILWTRHKLARRARLSILPNAERIRKFNDTVNKNIKILKIWNCPMRSEATFSQKANKKAGNLKLWYHGSIVPSRLPLALIKALKMFVGQLSLYIIGWEPKGHLGYARVLKEAAKGLEINKHIEFIRAIPTRKELLERCSECDIGLAFIPKNSKDINEQMMAGASNKPFEYLARGLAILVSDLPDWKGMYIDPGYGLSCNPDNPESIKGALQWFADHPEEMRRMGERGRQQILAEWNYEKQFRPVLKEINSQK